MLTLLSALASLLSFQLRSRASLELEVVALRHQVTVLRRQRPGRPRLFSADRLLWVWLYRTWPKVLDAMVLVKPATVIDWHRKGFRLYWRRRSHHLGRPGINCEVRDLIRQMGTANPLWGAPRPTARQILVQGQVRSEFVVVAVVGCKDPAQMGLAEDNDVIDRHRKLASARRIVGL